VAYIALPDRNLKLGFTRSVKSWEVVLSECGSQFIGIRNGLEGLTHMNLNNETDSKYIHPLTRENTVNGRVLGSLPIRVSVGSWQSIFNVAGQ
jgi:hypothetical protein